MTLQFTWDPRKAESNKRKHGISFEYAVRVFADPYALSEQDRVEDNEYRWQTIGLIEGIIVLLVAHTIEDEEEGSEVVHIISARRAERHERRRYEEEKHRSL
jgi:uncharacterized protein